MIDIHIYDEVSDSAEPTKEEVYDYPTDVGSEEDEKAAMRLEITSNPAYETVFIENEQGMYIFL